METKTDGTEGIQNTNDQKNTVSGDDKKFSQADVDKMISERLDRFRKAEESASKKKEADAAEAARIAALQGEERFKAEAAAERKKLEEEKSAIQTELDLIKNKTKSYVPTCTDATSSANPPLHRASGAYPPAHGNRCRDPDRTDRILCPNGSVHDTARSP